MANEIKASDTNITQASEMNRELYKTLTDTFDIRFTCMRVNSSPGQGLSVEVPQASFDETMSAPGEAGATTESALGTAKATVTSARNTLMYGWTDESVIAGARVSQGDLVEGLVDAYLRRVRDLVGEVIDGFTDTAGTSGAVLTLDDIFDGQFELIKNKVKGGPPAGVFSYKQITDLQSSMRGEGGVLQWQPAAADMLKLKGSNFQGSFNGIDFYMTDVKNDGTDDYGAIYYPGAVALREMNVATVRPFLSGNTWLTAARAEAVMWVEMIRVGGSGVTQWIGVGFPGVVLNEDAKGVTIQTVD